MDIRSDGECDGCSLANNEYLLAMNYTDRVAKGAAELDRILPGWELKIDLDSLYLSSTCNCVLGQLAVDLSPKEPDYWGPSGFDAAIDQIAPHYDWEQWAMDRGFDIEADEGPMDYVDLTEAWKRLIRQRLEA